MNEESMPKKSFSPDVRKYPTSGMMGSWAKGWEENIENEKDAESWFGGFERRFKKLGVEIRTSKVLEVGSGNSVYLDYLRKQGVDAVGVDARPRGKTEGLPIVSARIEQLPFPESSFDVVLSNAVFDSGVYNQNHQLMLKEIARVLKHDGLYVATLNRTKESIEELTLMSDPRDDLVSVFRRE